MQTYTHLHMEAVACLWEAMLDVNMEGWARDRENPNRSPLVLPAMAENNVCLYAQWQDVGSVEMRHAAIGLADFLLKTWDAMTENEQQDLIPYDWEFVPKFLAQVTWENGVPVTSENPREMANLILGKPVGTVKAPYGWDVA
ncbi:hypothetical protein [Pararhizobium sp. A13]|uniref:hypothetical protein n=1 Tax=Pararhizobium sp. A13 TaxID=3133975 RepID=UPI0032448F3C